jgi:hypothetical protein
MFRSLMCKPRKFCSENLLLMLPPLEGKQKALNSNKIFFLSEPLIPTLLERGVKQSFFLLFAVLRSVLQECMHAWPTRRNWVSLHYIMERTQISLYLTGGKGGKACTARAQACRRNLFLIRDAPPETRHDFNNRRARLSGIT